MEIYRLFTLNTVEEKIVEIAKRKLILDYGMKNQADQISNDVSVLKHIIEFGSHTLLDGQVKYVNNYEEIMKHATRFAYAAFTEGERSEAIEQQYNDFKAYSDTFWTTQFPEPADEGFEPNELNEQLSNSSFTAIVQAIIEYGSWRFADKVQTGMSADRVASAMFSVIKQCKQVASEFGVDIFNLPNQLQFTFQ